MKFTSVFVFLLTVSIYTINAQTTTGIKFFEGSWEEVLAEAKKQNKPVFVDAYTSWCGPCKWMAKNIFTLESIGEFFNKNFVNYKFNMEKGEGPAFARKSVSYTHLRAHET